jgi:hypothetical protein
MKSLLKFLINKPAQKNVATSISKESKQRNLDLAPKVIIEASIEAPMQEDNEIVANDNVDATETLQICTDSIYVQEDTSKIENETSSSSKSDFPTSPAPELFNSMVEDENNQKVKVENAEVPKNICENFSLFKTLKTNKPIIEKILQNKMHISSKTLTIDQINFINDKEVLFKNKDRKSTTFYKMQSFNNNNNISNIKNKYILNINNKNVSNDKHKIDNNFQQCDCELQYKNNHENYENINEIYLFFFSRNDGFFQKKTWL